MSQKTSPGRRAFASLLVLLSLAHAALTAPTTLPATTPAARKPATQPSAVALVEIKTDCPTALLDAGRPATWTLARTAAGRAAGPLRYRLKHNNAVVLEEGDLGDEPKTVAGQLDAPGWLYLEVTAAEDSGLYSPVAAAGAIVAADRLRPAAARPDDFLAFWKEQIARVERVPLNAAVKPTESPKPSSKLYEVTLDNVDDAKTHAQLAVPDRPGVEGKLPALVLYQSAGVYPMQKSWATAWSERGWLVLNVSAHDLPLYGPKAYYDDLLAGRLKSYAALGNGSRDTSYFRQMLLGDYQALRFVMRRPEFDRRTLLVMGTSQGGLQAFAMAALHPAVTAMVTNVPAGADTTGQTAGRRPGWPYWFAMKADDPAAVMSTSRYYDTANFAPDITCPALVNAGACDTTSPPPGVVGAANLLRGPHELCVMPRASHKFDHQPGQARITAWTDALRDGKPVPPPAAH